MKTPRIILAGGTGFLGQLLTNALSANGWEVIVLSRSLRRLPGPARMVLWDGKNMGGWARELEGAEAVINLSGRSVNCRYHPANRRLIMDSRVCPTKALGQAIAQCQDPPRVWLNASTATIYKHSLDRAMDETGEIGATRAAKDEFSVAVAQAWEEAFALAQTPATRHVALRTAMVFAPLPGTVFRVLRRLVKLGLGGSMAGGNQYVSWIHGEDFCRAVSWLIGRPDISGPVNLAAPHPLTNREMMRALCRVCRVPFGLPATLGMLEMGAFFLRTETELIIKSRRVIPARLLQAGFDFKFPRFPDAIQEIEERIGASNG